MYKETYYVIGNPLELDEDFMDSASGYFNTIGQAKQEIEHRIKNYGSHRNDYEIAKITTTIERKLKIK